MSTRSAGCHACRWEWACWSAGGGSAGGAVPGAFVHWLRDGDTRIRASCGMAYHACARGPRDAQTHLEKRASAGANIDSARQNLASTFVNAFMNVGFGTDKLMLTEGNKWLYKNKEHAMMSAAASLGAILLWDVDGGLTQIDKFLYSTDNNIKAGALLSVGLLSCGTRNECDPALALLAEYVEPKHPANIKVAAPPPDACHAGRVPRLV